MWMAQPVVTKIERLDDLRGQAAQSVVHALEIGFYRHLPMVAFREDIRQPDHGRPPPTASALPPMAGERPVQDLRETHPDHLRDRELHTVGPPAEQHPITLPPDLPRLFLHISPH